MKKLIIIIAAVGILAGCGGQNESVEKVAKVETEVKAETIVEVGNKYDEFQVEKSEYAGLADLMEDYAENFEPDSEYKSFQDEATAEWTLAFALLHYVNHFEDEIEAIGMTDEFQALQESAYAAFTVEGNADDQDVLDAFESKFYDVYEIYSQQ